MSFFAWPDGRMAGPKVYTAYEGHPYAAYINLFDVDIRIQHKQIGIFSSRKTAGSVKYMVELRRILRHEFDGVPQGHM